MLVKPTKKQTHLNINEITDLNLEIRLLEIMAKHPITITGDLASLSKLTNLSINAQSACRFEMTNLNQLEILKLSGITNINELVINGPSKLKHLKLAYCDLHSISHWICELENLEGLELQGNNLHELPNEFEWLKNLKRINLDKNSFREIPRVLAMLPILNHLSIDDNEVTREDFENFRRLRNSN